MSGLLNVAQLLDKRKKLWIGLARACTLAVAAMNAFDGMNGEPQHHIDRIAGMEKTQNRRRRDRRGGDGCLLLVFDLLSHFTNSISRRSLATSYCRAMITRRSSS